MKKRCLAGVDTLILRGSEHGTFSIAREWTNWADLDPRSSLDLPLPRLNPELLLELVNPLEQLGFAVIKRVTRERHPGGVNSYA